MNRAVCVRIMVSTTGSYLDVRMQPMPWACCSLVDANTAQGQKSARRHTSITCNSGLLSIEEGTSLTLPTSRSASFDMIPTTLHCRCGWQVGYFHGYLDGVDYVFVDHPAYHHVAGDIYAGSRTDILFRCALLCKVCSFIPAADAHRL